MTKENVLNFLEQNRGAYVSGAKIALALGVSRNAIWKSIRVLEKEGYRIDKRTNVGYKLLEHNDVLSANGIQNCFGRVPKVRVEVYQTLSSTNDYLINKAQDGEDEGLLVCAENQSAGKGRLGRKFFSPSGGVYFSLLLRPQKGSTVTEYLTVITAIAVCESVNELFGVGAGIKWVNDVYVGNKKCAGILTEASVDFETGSVAYAVIGIGINLNEPIEGYPDDIKDIACSLNSRVPNAKNKLVDLIVEKLMHNYQNFDKDSIVSKYRTNSIMNERKVLVKRESGNRLATALGIDDECRLIVKYENGEEERLYYGEVSLCLKD
ncbi:MAG: biotin--[Clostridia bacterium]|nr:biotin--[acetyl-CoA-carboxylase] ligase [Clostridia bacterium]